MVQITSSRFIPLIALIPTFLNGILSDLSGSSYSPLSFVNAASTHSDNSTDSQAGLIHMSLMSDMDEDDASFVHPWIKLQQHMNHGKRRMAQMKGVASPSTEEMLDAVKLREFDVRRESENNGKMLDFRHPRIKSKPQSIKSDESNNRPKRRDSRFDAASPFGLSPRRAGFPSTEAKMPVSYTHL